MSESNLLNSIPEDRLDSWKEIASFLRRGVRTVQRWEKDEGLPIHRHRHSSLDSVYAFKSEISQWQKSRKGIAVDSEPESLPATEVVTSAVTAALDSHSDGDASFVSQKSHFLKRGTVFALVLFVLLATVSLFLSRRPRAGVHLNLTPIPISTYLGEERSPALSPDGSKVAFVWNGEHQDNFDIYVKSIDSSQIQRLTKSPEVDYSPAWSPDGKWIAFCRGSQKPEGGLWVVPASGGAERRLSTIDSTGLPTGQALSWSPDEKFLVVSARLRASDRDGLHLLNVKTGEETRLTAPQPGENDFAPAVSPNGRWVAFSRDTGRGVSAVYLLPFESGKLVQTSPKLLWWRGSSPAWTPDGKQVVVNSYKNGDHDLWIVSINRPGEASLLPYGNDVSYPSISPLGQLAFVHETLNVNICKLDVQKMLLGRSAGPTEVVSSTRIQEDPKVSPDGTRLAFASTRSGNAEIWTSDIDGFNARQITSMRVPITGSPSWSPDGKTIAYDSRVSARPQIFSIPANGGRPVALTDGSHIDVVPRFSPDGKWIYFSSDRSGRTQIWKMLLTGAQAQQVTEKGGFGGVFSLDGMCLYYSRQNGAFSSLWQRRMITGEERCISSMVPDRAFAPVNEGVFYRSIGPDKRQNLMFLDLRSNKAERLYTFEKRGGVGVSVSPDQHTLYFAQEDQHSWDLQLVQGFWH